MSESSTHTIYRSDNIPTKNENDRNLPEAARGTADSIAELSVPVARFAPTYELGRNFCIDTITQRQRGEARKSSRVPRFDSYPARCNTRLR